MWRSNSFKTALTSLKLQHSQLLYRFTAAVSFYGCCIVLQSTKLISEKQLRSPPTRWNYHVLLVFRSGLSAAGVANSVPIGPTSPPRTGPVSLADNWYCPCPPFAVLYLVHRHNSQFIAARGLPLKLATIKILLLQVNGTWGLPSFVCDFYIAMDVTCSTSSIFNLVAISIDR